MKPIDFRNESFTALRERLSSLRRDVWIAWLAYEEKNGTRGATTRAVSAASGIDILTFRPRCTELFEMGVLQLAETSPTGHEGTYRLRSLEEWEAWHADQVQFALGHQQQLI